MTHRKRLTKCYECIWKGNQPPPGGREGLPWERTQSWWLGEEEEKISRTGRNKCEAPRAETVMWSRTWTTNSKKLQRRKKGQGRCPCSTPLLAPGWARASGTVSSDSPSWPLPFLPSSYKTTFYRQLYYGGLWYADWLFVYSPLNQKMDLICFAFLVPNKMVRTQQWKKIKEEKNERRQEGRWRQIKKKKGN